MYKTIIILLLIIVSLKLQAQVFPKEGSVLNYRITGFSYPALPNAKAYKIEIAKGNYTRVDSFIKNIVQSAESKDKRIIIEVPAFGSQYTWRVIYKIKKKTDSSPFYHFSTLMNDLVDTTKLHLRILQPAAEQYKDDYVVVDAGGVLYDMTGHPVWVIPNPNGTASKGIGGVVEFTQQGTVTFFCDGNGYETNYNGDVLWKTPNKGVVSGNGKDEGYHHQFTKLSNGHFMVLGSQVLMCKPLITKDSSYILVAVDKPKDTGYKQCVFGTLIEYDEAGNIVWSWKSSQYLVNLDFAYYMRNDNTKRYDPHENAFFFDEKNSCIYLGYRNLSRIIKIEYPSGKVLRTYGEIFKPGIPETGADLLCNQHSIRCSPDGYLYVFNNNSCRLTDSLPTVVFLQEPVSPADTFKKIWEYTCPIDGYFPKNLPKKFGAGGNTIELPDRDVFINMGSEYSRLLIVNREKQILWSGLPERFMEPDGIWTSIKEYRANIISRKDLEAMIWNAEIPGNSR
jgi:hypothetical protein